MNLSLLLQIISHRKHSTALVFQKTFLQLHILRKDREAVLELFLSYLIIRIEIRLSDQIAQEYLSYQRNTQHPCEYAPAVLPEGYRILGKHAGILQTELIRNTYQTLQHHLQLLILAHHTRIFAVEESTRQRIRCS